jgi:hypothetical protein
VQQEELGCKHVQLKNKQQRMDRSRRGRGRGRGRGAKLNKKINASF